MRLRVILLSVWTLLAGCVLFLRLGLPALNGGAHGNLPVLSIEGQWNEYLFSNATVPQEPEALASWYASHPRVNDGDAPGAYDEIKALKDTVQDPRSGLSDSAVLGIRIGLLEMQVEPSTDRAVMGQRIGALFAAASRALNLSFFDAAIAAASSLQRMTTLTPYYARALSIEGAATAEKAAASGGNLDRISRVNAGLDMLDRAVNLAPTDVSVRLSRGLTELGVPEFLHRVNQGWEDVLVVLESRSPQDLAVVSADERTKLSITLSQRGDAPEGAAERLKKIEAEAKALGNGVSE